jgi:predicted glycosyltransferase involved in capsule biosynthesis
MRYRRLRRTFKVCYIICQEEILYSVQKKKKKSAAKKSKGAKKKNFVSVIIAALDSHEIVRRQLLYFSRFMPCRNAELIIIDDGSEPPLETVTRGIPEYNYRIIKTRDKRPWTQPRARNIGGMRAKGDMLVFTDIDHVLSENCLLHAENADADMLRFVRHYGVLDEQGNVLTDWQTIEGYFGELAKREPIKSCHFNTFAVSRRLWKQSGGYDEKYCGKYGGDDKEFHGRVKEIVTEKGYIVKHEQAEMWVYPDVRVDKYDMFHNLKRRSKQ